MKKRKYIIPLIFSAATMLLIFIFSSQNGSSSSDISLKATRFLARLIFFDFNYLPEQIKYTIINELHGFVRKAAHFSVFALLGFNVFITLSFFIKKLKNQIITALLFCAAYASLDEIHQLFVSGRGASVKDVLIDISGSTCGIIAAVILFAVIYYIKSKNKQILN